MNRMTVLEERPDAELVSAAIAGDVSAFSALVRRHERSTYSLAYAVLRDRQLAEDATQDAFVLAYQSLPSLRDPAAFGPWVHTIVSRRANRLRPRRRPVAPLDAAGDVPAPDANGRLDADAERLLAAVNRLPAHERQTVLLHHFDGHDTPAVARMTGRTLGTVTKQLSRAYARLRDHLKEYPR